MPYQKTNTKLSLYWKCQLVGWGTVSLLWLYIALVRDQFTVLQALTNYVLDVSICIGLTHMYRALALASKWHQFPIKKLLGRVVPAVVVLSVLFMIIMNVKTGAYIYWVNGTNAFRDILTVWNPVLITGLRHMAIWVLAYHAYHFYMREVETTRAHAMLSVVAKQSQLDNLSAQLNPHFLFNALNSIKALVIENPRSARRAIDLLSELLRSSLYGKDHATIAIAEELALVSDYVELEQLRFEDRLRVTFDVDPGLHRLQIPPLCIQLLVENAIKHGVDKQLKGGTVAIAVQKRDGFVHIAVKNPGILSADTPGGLGLKNLRERLVLQYEGKAQLKVESPSEHLVEATLLIPIENP